MKGNLIGSLFIVALGAAILWVVWNGSQPAPVAEAGAGDLVLMDFYADWCGPCRAMKPVVHELASELQGRIQIVEVNVDQNPDLARQYQVRGIPCFVVLKGGREVNRRTGSMPKEALRELAGL